MIQRAVIIGLDSVARIGEGTRSVFHFGRLQVVRIANTNWLCDIYGISRREFPKPKALFIVIVFSLQN
jgi:hypothetical protein